MMGGTHEQKPTFTDLKEEAKDLNPPFDSPSLTPRLCIKLKIPQNLTSSINGDQDQAEGGGRGRGGDREAEGGVTEAPDGGRVCDICGKKFSSGKAWGGHKRHHLKVMRENNKNLKPKTNLHKKKKKKKKVAAAVPVADHIDGCNKTGGGDVKMIKDGKPICCLCGKIFPSMNSLFGHMRFHPGRGWKGTQPPPSPPPMTNSSSASLSSSSSSFSESEIDHHRISSGKTTIDMLSVLPPGWLKTDRRGRAGTIYDPIPQAACDLITLSRDNDQSAKKIRVNGLPLDQYRMKKKLARTNKPEFDTFDDAKKIANKKMKRKKKMNQITKNWYACSTCDQSFPTFQALGGHRSSCPNKNNTNNIDDGAALVDDQKSHKLPINFDEEDMEEEEEEDEDDEQEIVAGSFKCDICGKAFVTGQALGGHKRCHWRTSTTTPLKVITASSGEDLNDHNQARHGLLRFDLNEPYVDEE